ncbi:lysine N6-hydroxylase [Agreia bicolorata]|uniref:L-lysine N6-monooxygenase MbtG n=1 Tax=Agreia bicolorata TaxID=110935 RepID=A0A1T4YF54_9MICO|nr:SidA/IucD/PvdA family monooxygenase [Agreia bicolorata]KJC64426.1 L-lysine 6-monooxygenase [Agreia bicolorata]SKB00467.1 lysine N6-hydroxylase [Agreia bicolorata]
MSPVYDIVGVGIGPFGLGLAALAQPLPDVRAVFLDQAPQFSWHPGMMIEGTTLQVPFLADLVTLADPTSPYSFLAFLKAVGRLYPFYIRDSLYPLRSEYDEYCQWVAAQLPTLRWQRRVVAVEDHGEGFAVRAEVIDGDGAVHDTETYLTRHVVLGVGARPTLPAVLHRLAAAESAPLVIHSADYLFSREKLRACGAVTVIGSGQSAAEIYRDLLESRGRLDWVTRSPRFFPMEYTKLTLEMTSPEYTDHYHSLPSGLRDRLAREQRSLHKGISGELIDEIYDTLYQLTSRGQTVETKLLSDTEVVDARHDTETGDVVLTLHHAQLDRSYEHRTRGVVAATGYLASPPDFLGPIAHRVRLDDRGRLDVARRYTVDDAGSIHVLNGEEHTHGITAPDLGFGAWRASVILSDVTNREPYPIERRIAFQTFGLPDDHS